MTAESPVSGQLPQEWEISTIGETCEKPEYGYTETASSEPVGPRFLRITDIQDGGVDWNTVPYCVCPESRLDKFKLMENDILVARIGATTGKSFLIKKCPEAVFASYLIRLRATGVDPEFLYYYLNSEHYWRQIDANKGDKLKGGVSGSILASVKVVRPPFPEQRAIAAVLAKVQERIETQRRTVATLRELKAATMARLFREGTRGERLKQTEIGEMPESWEIVRLSKLADDFSGGTPSMRRPEYWGGAIPWCSPKDMKKPRLGDTIDHVTELGAKNGTRLVPAGSVFIVVRGMILAKDIPICLATVPMTFNQDMKAFVPKGDIDGEFILYVMRAFKEQLRLHISIAGHGTRRMGGEPIRDMQIALPPKDERDRMVRLLAALDSTINVGEQRCKVLDEIFSSLLHLLMTGRVRVARQMIEEAAHVS